VGLLALVSLVPAGLAGQQSALPGWLVGCWRLAEPDRVIEEVWLPPAGGALLGVSRTIAQDSLTSWELMVIRAGGNGLVYEASPSGQPPAAFLGAEASDSTLTFENLTHDFPQIIRYRRGNADSLIAEISGTVQTRRRAIVFPYTRAACP
jgi:hypothetical protein